jgi:hypothetical protein
MIDFKNIGENPVSRPIVVHITNTNNQWQIRDNL